MLLPSRVSGINSSNNKGMILNEKSVSNSSLLDVAQRMMTAARTAPKARGVDRLEIITVHEEKDLEILARQMEKIYERTHRSGFLRDAGNIRQAGAVVIIGSHNGEQELDCGYCGHATCAGKRAHGGPCVFPVNDMGIAIGSACATAADCRVDNRVMYTAGMAANELGWLGDDCIFALAIPLSATGKNPFFDRK